MSKDTAYHEIEFKLDADSDETLREIQKWMENSPKIFTRRTSRAPAIMQGLFQRPKQVTEERVRIYYDTEELDAFKRSVEIRQETVEKGGVKQMVKMGGNGLADDPIMDRMEYPSHLDEFGVTFDEIKDKEARRKLRRMFDDQTFKPLVAMVSQRTRLKYHPEGNTNILIEAAFDYPCWGFSFDGHVWQAPEMELEIVEGPQDHEEARKLLEREGRRFEEKFTLLRNHHSKPTPGFARLRDYLKTPDGKRAFRKLSQDQAWWMTPQPSAQFAGVNTAVARKLLAS